MDLSFFFARIMGPVFFIMGLGLLANPSYFQEVARSIAKHHAYVVLGGFLNLVLGLLVVLHHNLWESSWVVIVTLVGWLLFLKGVFLFVFPRQVVGWAKAWSSKNMVLASGLVTLGIGVYFGYVAYFL